MKSNTANTIPPNNTDKDSLSMNAPGQENNLESGKIITTNQVKNTPFHIVTVGTTEGHKHFIAVGMKRITALTDNSNELLRMIRNKDWSLLTSLITIITEGVTEETEREKKNKEHSSQEMKKKQEHGNT